LKSRTLVFVLIIITFSGLIFYFGKQLGIHVDKSSSLKRHQLYQGSMSFKDIDHQKFKNGKIYFQVLASSAVFRSDQTIYFDQGATFKFYQDSGDVLVVKGGKATIYIAGKKSKPGFLETYEAETLKVWENVEGKSETYSFFSDHIDYEVKEQVMRSNHPTKFISNQFIARGNKFKFNIKTKEFLVSGNVKGYIYPEDYQKSPNYQGMQL